MSVTWFTEQKWGEYTRASPRREAGYVGLSCLTVPLASTQPMAQDSIALPRQQLLVNVTGQGDFSASEASCAMVLLVSTQLPNRMAELCQRQTGWCGPLFDHALHHVERWLPARVKTELQIFLSVQQRWRLKGSSSWACVLAFYNFLVGTWWICPVTSKHIWIVTYRSINHLNMWTASSMAVWGSFTCFKLGFIYYAYVIPSEYVGVGLYWYLTINTGKWSKQDSYFFWRIIQLVQGIKVFKILYLKYGYT